MPVLSRVLQSAVIIGFSVLAAGCGTDPKVNAPTPIDPVTIVGVNVEGPTRLAPGETAQFVATVNLSNFAVKSPPNVSWVASPPSFLRVDAAGVATGGPFPGGAAVTARVIQPNGTVIQKSLDITVVPQNTFVLLGAVTDEELHPLPVPGARVEASPGSHIATTDPAGFYRLFGVPLTLEVKVSADGYQTQTKTLELGGDSRQDFRLALSKPRLNLSGAYTLTLEIKEGCPNSLPLQESLRFRQYDAVITQTGLALQVVLTEPRFHIVGTAGNKFGGQANATGATFDLSWDDFGYPKVVERLPDGTFLVTYGVGSVTGTSAGLSGFAEAMAHYGAGFPGTLNLIGSCVFSPQLTLKPR